MGGDPAAPTTQESMDEVLKAFSKHMPGLMQTTSNSILPTEQAKLAASQAVSPAYAALEAQLYGQYAPQMAAIGQQINQSNRLADAGADLAVLKGPGQQLARSAVELDRNVIDPEFYKTREAIGAKNLELLNSINLGGLSGGERAEVERATNAGDVASGNLGNASAVNTVSRAMNYGDRLQQKQSQLGNAIAAATQSLQPMRSGIDPFGRPSVRSDESRVGNATQTGADSMQMGGNLLSSTTAMRSQENQINADRRDSLDRVSQVMGSLPNVSM